MSNRLDCAGKYAALRTQCIRQSLLSSTDCCQVRQAPCGCGDAAQTRYSPCHVIGGASIAEWAVLQAAADLHVSHGGAEKAIGSYMLRQIQSLVVFALREVGEGARGVGSQLQLGARHNSLSGVVLGCPCSFGGRCRAVHCCSLRASERRLAAGAACGRAHPDIGKPGTFCWGIPWQATRSTCRKYTAITTDSYCLITTCPRVTFHWISLLWVSLSILERELTQLDRSLSSSAVPRCNLIHHDA